MENKNQIIILDIKVTVCQTRPKIIVGANFPLVTVCQTRPKLIFGTNFPLVTVSQNRPKLLLVITFLW